MQRPNSPPRRIGGGVSNLYEYVVNDPVNYADPSGTQRIYVLENAIKNWISSVSEVSKMFTDWATGSGDEERAYRPGSSQVKDMMNANGVERARQYFYNKNKGKCPDEYEPLTNFDPGFGLPGLWNGGLDPTEQFVGDYRVKPIPLIFQKQAYLLAGLSG